jgi:glucose/arabinose dehydrogenase
MNIKIPATCVSAMVFAAVASVGLPAATAGADEITVNLEPVAEGLTHPTDMQPAPDGRMYILEQPGRIHIFEDGQLLDDVFLDITDRVVELEPEFDERGLLGIAFHPDYAENGRFFVYYSAPMRGDAPLGRRMRWNHTAYLSEFSVSDDDPNRADPDSERQILEIDQPAFNHNGGQVLFGPDGYLYLGLGDGGAAHDLAPDAPPEGYGQHRETLLGKILRIDVDNGDPYGIPEDNPFVDEEPWEPEIYALGFRNPWRMSFDTEGDNELYAADVGQWGLEGVYLVEAGNNYSWRIKEGTFCFDPHAPLEHPEECPDEMWGLELLDPIVEYKHLRAFPEEGVGISITGGYIYRGEAIPELQGMYVFGDWSRSFTEPDGVLMSAEPADEGLWTIHKLNVGNMDEPYPFIKAFGRDHDGELYVLTSGTHGPRTEQDVIYKIVPAE